MSRVCVQVRLLAAWARAGAALLAKRTVNEPNMSCTCGAWRFQLRVSSQEPGACDRCLLLHWLLQCWQQMLGLGRHSK